MMYRQVSKPGWLMAALLLIVCSQVDAQVRAVYDQGTTGLLRQLQRLQTTASVLHTGAHPDDEDSALVAYHARGLHARTAYLSLTRGSGGQNIIGSEQSDLLGIIRTEELLQARRLDGATQYFTRANDFGFSKTREEAGRLWDEEQVVADMVRAIRQMRPLVVVSRWSGTPADGHGHHQFAGYVTPRAIAAAADPARFPEQLARGLLPWRVAKLYVAERFSEDDSENGRLIVDTGINDPVAGQSYFQIGMRGRSQQKTQQMGSMEYYGSQYSVLKLVHSTVGGIDGEGDLFAGVDTSLPGIARFEEGPVPELEELLTRLDSMARQILEQFQPLAPQQSVPALAAGLALAREARGHARSPDARRLLEEKSHEYADALLLAAGIHIDALADRETIVPGENFKVAVRVYERAGVSATVPDVSLRLPAEFTYRPATGKGLPGERQSLRRDSPTIEFGFDVEAAADARPTEPYWLRRPRSGFQYDWSAEDACATLPFCRSSFIAAVRLEVGGQVVDVEREVEFRYADRVRGEIRRRLDVVPRVTLAPRSSLELLSTRQNSKEFEMVVAIANHGSEAVAGELDAQLPLGWRAVSGDARFDLESTPATSAVSLSVSIPESAEPGEYRIPLIARVAGSEYRRRMDSIAYPHIRTHRSYRAAEIIVRIVDVDVAPVLVGYVMGSGDEIPAALARLDIDVSLLDDEDLATGDLKRFDTIVVGIRASQTRPAFVANNARLLDFARQGGALIVQYQQPDYIEQGLPPFPASMGEQTVRVVDETAPVQVLDPQHPVFSFPNRISAADFDGWVQERNNYNFATFDTSRYVALTESHDPGEPESYGGMVYASLGEGHYVYTGYSWFRQLPSGVPGAYRLFANLLSLGEASNE
jgi:LmbE family N-acetylglucosaminyl deacetylase